MFDQFGREITYLRVSVTDRCNLRCGYCMPAEGVPLIRHEDILSFEEIEQVVSAAAGMGMWKIRLTGGEPLVRKGIVSLVAMLAAIPGVRDLAMTTNGTLLAPCADALKRAGLHRLNISLDTVNPDNYRELTRGGNLNDVLAGIDAARAAGFDTIKINCVIENSDEEPDARAVAAFARENGLAVRFIRRMTLANGKFWKVNGGDGGDCKHCSRLRLSSDGRVIPCLFDGVSFSVRELGAERALRSAIDHKPERGTKTERGIYAIGG